MPPAARITDQHVCPKVNPGPVPHVGGPTTSGEATVLIGYQPAARVGDSLLCVGPGATDSISQGEPTVIIGGRPAARLGDPTSHGGVLVAGCPTVIIGSSVQSNVIQLAAHEGTPFCEECAKKQKRVVRMYWTYGKEEIPLTDQSRFYVDMNLHIETENYTPGESVTVTISRDDGNAISEGVQELSFTAIVKEGGEAKIEDVFNNSRVDIVMKD